MRVEAIVVHKFQNNMVSSQMQQTRMSWAQTRICTSLWFAVDKYFIAIDFHVYMIRVSKPIYPHLVLVHVKLINVY